MFPAGKTVVFSMMTDSVLAAQSLYNKHLQQSGMQPIELLGDSKTMEDLLSRLSSSYGHSRMFITDEGVRKFQELGQYKPGESHGTAVSCNCCSAATCWQFQ